MRDPNRIKPILAALEQAWQQNPDFRLTQLIIAAASMVRDLEGSSPTFYVEDDVLLAGIEKIKKIKEHF